MNISITFNPAVDSSHDIALRLAYAYGYESIGDLVAADPEDDPEAAEVPTGTALSANGWTASKMRRYIKALKPTARAVLRVIAENAPEVSIEDVQAAAGLQTYQYAGSMSSFGFAARNTHGVKEKPFEKIGKAYHMNEAVAEIAITALGHLGF